MKTNRMTNRRKYIGITIVLFVALAGLLRWSTARSKDTLAADNFNGLYLLVFSENDKKQDEFLRRIEKMHAKFYALQEKRLAHLEQQNDRLLAQIETLKVPPATMSVREKLVYMVPYVARSRFPAYIWQTWKHGLNDDRFDANFKEGQAQWAFRNPGFVHELFNDDTSLATIKHLYSHVPEVLDAYESMPEVVLRMDFFRYLILFARGGVYADIDTMPLQPVPNWIPENVEATELGMIICVGNEATSKNWRAEAHRRLEFGQFIIQSKPGHPVLREIIAQITEATLAKKRALRDGVLMRTSDSPNQKLLDISRWTGSGVWTDVVFEYLNDYVRAAIYQLVSWQDFHALQGPKLVSDILILPTKSFASELEVPKDGKIADPIAFAKHWSANIWKTT
ncbi:hypothetical protein METBIDRAFT_107145 [Metschnikowia bicuspidata var. bicuspidata NRRL YB-4993]|uniref:Alpha-1,6-mannosyltransferase n=1 Tax=Metschnikowia bicuspidata var. bicuspidata NRRL YB-4993 TaxID=869754 RepID=A0A1A0HHN8_9ASCO|nr:hypothetical protein METBIDRAFT_107145 [Metschnikowia bicuspidata var. bicuspidata NRRL YB-4993]OBA23521.1 hypothetical protein METBIDRAFT_107145 [Metschnikowia bicuspidata var. bicuspidata NRRL YB-4993]